MPGARGTHLHGSSVLFSALGTCCVRQMCCSWQTISAKSENSILSSQFPNKDNLLGDKLKLFKEKLKTKTEKNYQN